MKNLKEVCCVCVCATWTAGSSSGWQIEQQKQLPQPKYPGNPHPAILEALSSLLLVVEIKSIDEAEDWVN